jgi:hypothetical protein
LRGVQKHDKKYQKNKSDPSPLLASDPPTHYGGHRFLFWRLLGPVVRGRGPTRSEPPCHCQCFSFFKGRLRGGGGEGGAR